MQHGRTMIKVGLTQTRDVANMRPICGAFLICMEMSGSGPRIDMQTYPTDNPVVDPIGPASGFALGSSGVVP